MRREGSAQKIFLGGFGQKVALFVQRAKKVVLAEHFWLKTSIAHTGAQTIIALFDIFLGYEYKNCVLPKV